MRVLSLDDDPTQPSTPPAGEVEEGALAYVIYTSGSTGRPKGAMNTHGGIVNRLLWMQEAFGLTADDRILQKTPVSFDVSVWELFWPLIAGARVVMARPGGHQDPSYLAGVIAREEITAVHFVPSLLAAFLETPDVHLPALRRVIASGEALTEELRRRCAERLAAPLFNLYGPTEAAVDVTWWPCTDGERTVPIGRPLANVRIHVLDAALRPVPPGIAGELCIAGVQVARGYLGRPELTAERFVPDPLAEDLGERIYRTGDVARWRPDGMLEALGRRDAQVKVRGFRIEPGEVEAALTALPGVVEAAVLAVPDGSGGFGGMELVAYVTGTGIDAGIDTTELRRELAARLPAPMVPSRFSVLAELPRTPNGKVDRQALAARRPDAVETGEGGAPRTPTEELLADIWTGLLDVERVGREDDFFALGGHSLLAARVMARVQSALGAELSVRTVFEAPTLAALAQRVDEAARSGQGVTAPRLRRVPRRPQESLPLSFSQEWMWLIDQLDPTASAFSVTFPVRLGGRLDAGALGRALSEVARRHEILRTTFPLVDGRPLQRISAEAGLPLAVVDLSVLSGPAETVEAGRIADVALGRTLDLLNGPLAAAVLLRHGADDHTLLLTLHHILFDGWSAGILLREVAALYGAFAAGRPSPLPELPLQYGDFAVWQREWLQGPAEEPLLAYWRERLTPPPPHLDLPGARREPVTTLRSARASLRIPAETTAALHTLARREGATLFMVLLAIWQTLLSRTTRQTDIAVGAPVAGRNRREVEDLIGYFVNPLVMRTDLAGDPSFRDAVGRAREVALGAWAHQDLPFTRLVAELQPDRAAGRTPFFQVMLLLQNMPVTRIELPELTLTSVDHEVPLATFDLTLVVVEEEGGLAGSLWYNRDLLDSAAVASLIDQLRALLAGAVADPDLRLSALPLLTEAARRQLLEGRMPEITAADTAEPLVPLTGDLLHTLFEARAEAEPDAVALVFEGDETSYGDLNRSANRLARHLRGLGVGPEDRVGLCLGRSPRLVAAVLAVLKAGAGYLPFDPHYPRERLAFLLADAGVKVLLAENAEHLPTTPISTVWLDDPSEEAAIASRSDEDLGDVGATPASLAYVIYTSGSTGTPKGVMVPHGNVTRLFESTDDWFRFDERDTWTLFHSYAFDFSVWEIWGALLHGGRLVLVPWTVSRSPEDFHALLCREKVTVLNQTPSAFGALMQAEMAKPAPANRRDLPLRSLRWVIFGGEALSLPALAPWIERYGDPARNRPRLVNMYGITETTVHVTYRPLAAADLEAGSVLGEPIPDLEVYLLDESLEPVPVGVAGEMYVGGAGLARGYLGRPDLTAERFVPDPFAVGNRPGRRLYRTGDLARRSADGDRGDLEYLGRSDGQVKIRGFRIEPGEIEAALIRHPAVADAVVVAREDIPGDRRLVAYLVPDPQRAQPVRNLLRLEREGRLNGRPTFELPNGMVVAHQNEGVTLGIFKEIFQGQVYRRHGIALPAGATVFDVGANMGLFTLWVGTTVPRARLFSFEPIPATAEVLALNAEIHGLDATVYAAGIAEAERTETFTYYPFFSSTSGRFPDLAKDRADIKAHILNEQRQLDAQMAREGGSTFEAWRLERESALDGWLDEHMKSEKVSCRLTTISSVIREHGLERIDLLKIDAERSELDALAGLADEDWPKVRQLVIEVHDAGIRDRVVEILGARGFALEVEQDVFLEGTELYNVYARRPADGGGEAVSGVEAVWSSPSRLVDDVRHAAAERLPESMLPAAFVVLESLPLTAHGKVDRKALPAPQEAAKGAERPIVEPRTPVERELVDIWKELLRVDRISIYDNFFELGGHSLLLTQLASRIRTTFQVEIPLRVLFDVANIVEMTEAIAERQVQQVDQDEMTAMLDELRGLSPEEIKALLEAEG